MTSNTAARPSATPATITFLPPTQVLPGKGAGEFRTLTIKHVQSWEKRNMGKVLRTFTEYRHGHTVITHLLPNQGMMIYVTDSQGNIVRH